MAEAASAFATDDGLARFGAGELAVLRALDAMLLRMAGAAGAEEVGFAPLSTWRALDRIDYFRNFPHLGLAASPLAEATVQTLADARTTAPRALAEPDALQTPRYFLASAACYPVYALHEDAVLAGPVRRTLVQHCFRNEGRYEGLARLLAFRMREFVVIGQRELVLEDLTQRRAWIEGCAGRLGLELRREQAADPFFEAGGARARMQQLFPVKEEFVAPGGVAVSSVNFHRNFFGERWNIRCADGEYAYSGCVAFGLERWLHVLAGRHGADHAALVRLLDGLERP